jgi:hypothetical protein
MFKKTQLYSEYANIMLTRLFFFSLKKKANIVQKFNEKVDDVRGSFLTTHPLLEV